MSVLPKPDANGKRVQYTAPGDGDLWRSALAIATMPGLTEFERQVAGVLMAFADTANGKCCPSEATIADVLGRSERQVRRALTKLKGIGFVTPQARFKAGGQQRRNSNAYDIHWHVARAGFDDLKARMKRASASRFEPDTACPNGEFEPDICRPKSGFEPDISRHLNRTPAMSSNRAEKDRAEKEDRESRASMVKEASHDNETDHGQVPDDRLAKEDPEAGSVHYVFKGKAIKVDRRWWNELLESNRNDFSLITSLRKADGFAIRMPESQRKGYVERWLAEDNQRADLPPMGAIRLRDGSYVSRW